jgi:hypothetical protein
MEGVRDTCGYTWCSYCLRWVRPCRDGTMRSHPRSSDSLPDAERFAASVLAIGEGKR